MHCSGHLFSQWGIALNTLWGCIPACWCMFQWSYVIFYWCCNVLASVSTCTNLYVLTGILLCAVCTVVYVSLCVMF